MDWFLYDIGLRHEKVKYVPQCIKSLKKSHLRILACKFYTTCTRLNVTLSRSTQLELNAFNASKQKSSVNLKSVKKF